MNQKKRLFILDTMALAFKSHHAFSQRPLQTKGGFPTSSIFGSASFLLRLIEKEKPDYLVAATDTRTKTFRHHMFPQYKAHRGDMPEDLSKQIPVIYEMLDLFGIPLLTREGVEADDLIGSLVTRWSSADLHCYIVSGDKDFMQLVNDHVSLYVPQQGGKVHLVDALEVHKKFSCTPDKVIDVRALCGDSSDNIPGIKGIGEKGAANLVMQFGSLDDIYAQLAQVKNPRLLSLLTEQKDNAYLSRELVKIKIDEEIHLDLCEMSSFQDKKGNNTLLHFFSQYELKSLVQIVEKNNQSKDESLRENCAAGFFQEPTAKGNQPTNNPGKDESLRENCAAGFSQEPTAKGNQLRSLPLDPSLLKESYILVNTKETLENFKEAMQLATIFSFDTETTGLDIIKDVPIGISFGLETGYSYYLPLLAKHLIDITPEELLSTVKPFFADPQRIKVAHNFKFDAQMLQNIHIEITTPFYDSMLAAFLVNPSERSFGLDALSEKYLGVKKIPITELMGPKKKTPMEDAPLEKLLPYTCEDAECCLKLFKFFTPTLEEQNLWGLYQDLEIPLVPILASMEKSGIHIDKEVMATLSQIFQEKRKEIESSIFADTGEEFNLNSPKQLSVILFEKMRLHEVLGIKKIKKTKTGFSTDSSVLELLSEHPLPQKILEYRLLTKLQSTYSDVLPDMVHPQTGRIHTSFQQTGTATGRLSSISPNLQNIPIRSEYGRQIRDAFRAEKDHVLISADYSQIELRILAHLSQDENLKKAFTTGEDIHRETASIIFSKPLVSVTNEERQQSKAINYGIVYGMGPKKLAHETGMTIPKAKIFIEKYFASFPKIQIFISSMIEKAERLGYSSTLLGRRRPIAGLDGSLGALVVAQARSMAVNSCVQGSAADLIKMAMVQIAAAFKEKGFTTRMLLQVHDELVFESSKEELELVIPVIRECMEKAIALDVPLVVDVGYGTSWLDAH